MRSASCVAVLAALTAPARALLRAVASKVEWRSDRSWLDLRRAQDLARSPATKGCCPAATAVYRSTIGSRCCLEKADSLPPWRPVGGEGWESARHLWNQTLDGGEIVVAGDSMAGQIFVALLCLAWATPGHGFVDLVADTSAPMLGEDNRRNSSVAWSATILPHGAKVRWVRLFGVPESHTRFLGEERYFADWSAYALRDARLLVLSGWMHGLPSMFIVHRLLERLSRNVTRPDGAKTLLVEALPQHFPGGLWQRHQQNYPASATTCTPTAPFPGGGPDFWKPRQPRRCRQPALQKKMDSCGCGGCYVSHGSNFAISPHAGADFNEFVLGSLAQRSFDLGLHPNSTALLQIAHLYASRGEAHVEHQLFANGADDRQDYDPLDVRASKKQAHHAAGSTGARDCLHWCIQPGVLDALGLAIVDALEELMGRDERAPSATDSARGTGQNRNLRHEPARSNHRRAGR